MDNYLQQVSEVEKYLKQLKSSLAVEADSRLIQNADPIPLRITLTREGLSHRIAELCESALLLLQSDKPIAASILGRAVLETVAVLSVLARRVEEYADNADAERLNSFLEKAALGSRNDDTQYDATNVLTYVQKMDRSYPGTQDLYLGLCEQSHPNWAGTSPYVQPNEQSTRIRFGGAGTEFLMMVPAPILVSLRLACEEYVALTELQVRISDRGSP